MNEWEVEEAAQNLKNHEVLGKASAFLLDFKDLINSISDGWPYWGFGTKCSESLQKLVNDAKWPATSNPKPADVKKAQQKVINFLNRLLKKPNFTSHGHVTAFLESHTL